MASVSPVYSFSRVTTFEQCPRRFRYQYVDGVKQAFRGVEAFMGQQVHSAIEWLFVERDRAAAPTAAKAVEYYCACWDREVVVGGAPVRVIKHGTEMESYRRAGAELVSRFHGEQFVSDRLETVALEKHFTVELGGCHRFQGFIDRLARDSDGLLHLIDFKTGRRAPSSFEGKEADQVRAYALAMFMETDAGEIELRLEFLRARKRLRSRIERADAEAVEQSLVSRIAALEDSTVFPPVQGILCDWCGYNDICEAYRPRQRRPAAARIGGAR